VLNRLRRLRSAARWRRRGPESSAREAQVEELLRLARMSFVRLQAAWDRADLGTLGDLATAPLLDDLRQQLALRGPGPNCTEVLSLDARLLLLEDLQEARVASVEFTGLIREAREH
jgi:predicted lipid-binding transport protein (Tim44 family)